ncbi:TetR/AcrR family transcriptional regulator [Actinoplanes rectilineatus]|uniref:TetR/AcrR family transcriptional regulator n=1 Tax=Actinoplanes rectilineatus TaxID=113571 RepID=UPI00069874B0|nr:TetR/AcrR family transcriptional regulator [Actinoplanes rectilineatus]
MTTDPDPGPGRRRGPRTDLDVRARLVAVAERMFGEQGLDPVSARAVAREAGVAPGALAYHFPAGKTALVAAVIDRRMTLVGADMSRHLSALLERDGEVTPRELIEAVLMPAVALIQADPVGGLRWMRIIARLQLAEDPSWAAAVNGGPRLDELLAAVSARVLPERDRHEVGSRVGIAVFSVLALLVSPEQVGGTRGAAGAGLDPGFVERLADFAAAGIEGSWAAAGRRP